jgi:peptidylamidoglycolate lyase
MMSTGERAQMPAEQRMHPEHTEKKRLRLPRWIAAALVAGVATATAAAAGLHMHGAHEQKGGSDAFGPYEPVANWLKPMRPGYLERGVSVFAESPDRILFTSDLEFVPHRGRGGAGPPAPGAASPDHHFVMVLDRNGNVVDEWKQWDSLFKMPHRVAIDPYDPERNVWIIDRENEQIFKFSHDGKKLLMTLGEKGVIGNDDRHFGRPADISFLPDGSFYVADGYTNTRVIKFDKNGKFLFAWGTPGSGRGQFKVQVHDVAVDPRGRVFVADRGNNRIQIFDPNGEYLDEWDNIRGPSYIHITKDGYVWVVSGQGNRLAKYDMNGHLLTYWGMYGREPGEFDDPHDMSVDADGNLYVAIFSTQKVGLEKFVPRPDADPSRLVGPGFNRSLPLMN